MHNRAQIGLVRFFLSLGVGAIVVWIVTEIGSPILSGAENATTNGTANQATGWFQTGADYLPVIFLFIAFFGVIALAVFQREVLR
jgi:hypothetical protein